MNHEATTFDPSDDASREVRERIGHAPKPTRRTLFLRQFAPVQMWKAGKFGSLILSVVKTH